MFQQIAIPQMTWGAADTAAVTMTWKLRAMQVSQISIKINDPTNAITWTLEVKDANDGVIYTKASIPDNATTVYAATKDTEDFHEFLIGPDCVVSVTPSGAPGSAAEVDMIFGAEE